MIVVATAVRRAVTNVVVTAWVTAEDASTLVIREARWKIADPVLAM